MNILTDASLRLGLTEDEANRRLIEDGPNELPRRDVRNAFAILVDVLREPMFMFLVGAAVIYVLLGSTAEALLLSAFATTSVIITIVQEFRSERVLQALTELSSPKATVIREGQRRKIPGRDVARGDCVSVSEGDRIPADGVLVHADNLTVDESILTGESVPVVKLSRGPASERPGGDGSSSIFSGTLVVGGQGVAEVTATGPRSEIGKIGASVAGIEVEPPRLKAETLRLVRAFSIIGAVVCVLAVALQIYSGQTALKSLLAGIALGMALLPEEFPLVLTVFTVMGAWRISQANVLTRRASSIEALGEATVLCTDKTGTLTENRMAIAELRLPSAQAWTVDAATLQAMPLEFKDLVSAGALASHPNPVDPMDAAFVGLAVSIEAKASGIRRGEKLLQAFPLTPGLLAVTNVWSSPRSGHGRIISAKGAPEAIANLCQLPSAERAAVLASADDMARRGLRVLGIAAADLEPGQHLASPAQANPRFVGLAGLADPLRPSAISAVESCAAAGIRVVMITGDYPVTASAIALQAGIKGALANGDDVRKMSNADLQILVRDTSVFSRITPTEKLRIVEALKANGEIVAMTGDGVNDAPSLKAAHIGIAMGRRGTDVAREAASLVLLDDDLTSIVRAIRLGRRIFDNLSKAMGFIAAIHVPIAGLAVLPMVMGLPPILGPIHIAFLEMVIDPVCSIAFENEEEEQSVMTRPPRSATASLMPAGKIAASALQGFIVLALLGLLTAGANRYGLPPERLNALVFGSLITSTMALVLVNRSAAASLYDALARRNPILWAVFAAAAVLYGIVLMWAPARDMFQFGELYGRDLAVVGITGLISLLCLEAFQMLAITQQERVVHQSQASFL